MTLTTHLGWKSRLVVVTTVLALTFWGGLMMSAPVDAQGTEDVSEITQLDSTGVLYVQVYDELTRRPVGDQVITIFDRGGEQVAQATTTCNYLEFNDLSTGWYRVVLEQDPDWATVRRTTASDWVMVHPGYRTGVRFFVSPDTAGATLRVLAYDANQRQANRPREPLAGAAFTVYDAGGNFVANGVTGCSGFVDFQNLAAGDYRVVDANEANGGYIYPPSGERWVSLQSGTLTSVWFFTVPSPGPQTTPTAGQ